jgi:hypothetical protein
MRLFELTAAGFLVLKLLPIKFLLSKELSKGLLTLTLLRMDLEVLGDLRPWDSMTGPVPLSWRKPDLIVLPEVIRLGSFEVFDLGTDLIDRGAAETLVLVLPIFVGRLTLGAAELFCTCWLFRLPPLDLALLLRAFFPKTGLVNSINTTANVTKAILTLSLYFGLNMIRLLSLATFLGRQPNEWLSTLPTRYKPQHLTEFYICFAQS